MFAQSVGWFSPYIWLAQIGILLLVFYFGNRLLKKRLEFLLQESPRKKSVREDFRIALVLPSRVLLASLVFVFSMQLIAARFDLADTVFSLKLLRNAAIVICLSWLALRWKECFYHSLVKSSRKSSLSLDNFSLEMVRKLLNIFIIFIAILVVLQIFGLDIIPFVTFGGIGVAAIGFASKDVIANYFSGFMIYATRPFSVGDIIEIPEKKLFGTVEEIGWYLTSLRDLDKKPVYIPNYIFSTGLVINISRMTHRFFNEILQVRYKDVSKVVSISKKVKEYFEGHPLVDKGQMLFVFFRTFGLTL